MKIILNLVILNLIQIILTVVIIVLLTSCAPPTEEVYDTITLETKGIEELKSYITWNLCQLNKPYDLLRACLLFVPVTLRTEEHPDKPISR